MNEGMDDNNSSILQIKELKEKVRSLVSEVDLNRENAKFKHETIVDSNLSSSVYYVEDEEEFLDCSEIESLDETNWLTKENASGESVEEIYRRVYSGVDDDRPDVTALCRQLQSSSIQESNIFAGQKASIDSRTFTRPKKFSSRPPLTSVVNSGEDGRPKLLRRLTTTISPTPNLISKLEELSKTNNRPVSGNYSDVNWQDGAVEGLAEVEKKPAVRPSRQSLPASLYDRLQELKKANSSYKLSKVVEPSIPNGKVQDYARNAFMEDAKKVTAALDVDLKSGHSSARLSEIFRNTQDYYSDDNESFISLDEVSGFCDRLTLSTDQSTYSSIVKEMEQHEICLFHRTLNEDKAKDRRLTFGGMEIPSGDFPKNRSANHSLPVEEETELNRTYEIDEDEPPEKANGTFEVKKTEKHNIMNLTYDANKKPGLTDVILQSEVIKNLAPSNGFKKGGNLNNNNNNNRVLTACEGNNILNSTYDKLNGTLDQNELNALHTEKYSTKVFDSSFRKSTPEARGSPTRRTNGKKDSDYSEDDCMSTTSDNSCRSVESNSEARTIEELRTNAAKQSKKFSSTPLTEQRSQLRFDVVSPIRMEVGDGESNAHSNSSSRGQSPRRSALGHQEGLQKLRMPNIRQPLKVPQRELKLKPALVRPTQNVKRPQLSYARTSSEPSVPQKVESCQPAVSAPVLRPSGPTAVPSLTNVRPSGRVSGIPRPPTRLKQPQISEVCEGTSAAPKRRSKCEECEDSNMTKQINCTQGGDFEIKDERRRKEASVEEKGRNRKERHTSQEKTRWRNENNIKIQEYEMRERERRERYEREVAEAERNERELEMEKWEKERARKLKNSGSVTRYKPRRPPAGYKDPHEVCKQALPKKVKEEKRQEIKALMNCIAFTPSQTDLRAASEEEQNAQEERKKTAEEIDNSLSSDTTSDITDVTPRSSSSGCSSMSKQSMCLEKAERGKIEAGDNGIKTKHDEKLKRENEINLKKSNMKSFEDGKKKDNQIGEQEAKNLTEVELEEMKYLQDAFEDLDVDEETSDFASSIISGLSEERRAKCNRKNMTFTNEQLREIERVNLILLKKIMNHRKPRMKSQCQPIVSRKTSAAINRARMEEKIERENKILLKKLQSAKGTTGTLSRKRSSQY